MMFRLYKRRTIEQAKQDLIELLVENPQGLRTSQLIGTKNFHGCRTLSPRQVHRLLRSMPEVEHSYDGCGCRAPSWWRLRTDGSIGSRE